MTIEKAKLIISTYTLPMTNEQLKEYKQALALLSGFYLKKL